MKPKLGSLTCVALFSLVTLSCVHASHGTEKSAESKPNELTPAERKAGWKLLFDGQSTHGWRGFNKEAFPNQGWVVEDDCLKLQAKSRGGDIITIEQFTDFEFQFEWRIAPGANSGVKYFTDEARGEPIGHEYQLVDDLRHPDGKRGPKWQTASFYDVLPARDKSVRPVGEFNQPRLPVQ